MDGRVKSRFCEKDFDRYYQEKIYPVLKQINADLGARQARRKTRFILTLLLALGVFASLLGGFLVEESWGEAIRAIGLIMLPGAYVIFIGMQEFRLRKVIANRIIPLLLAFLGKLEFQSSVQFDWNEVNKSKLFYSKELIYNGDYLICGEYENIPVLLGNAHLSVPEGEDDRTVFSGQLILLKRRKPVISHVIIKFNQRYFGNFIDYFVNKPLFNFANLQRIKFDDTEFEKFFTVYAMDETLARSIVNPKFIDKILKLNKTYFKHGIACSFYDDKLLIALPNLPDMYLYTSFIATVLKKDSEMIREMLDGLKSILAAIKELGTSDR